MPPPSPSPPLQTAPLVAREGVRRSQRRALGYLALAALGCIVRLAMPVGIGLFLGALLAFTLEPLYSWVRRRGLGPGPSALSCALGATLTLAATVLTTSVLLVTSGFTLSNRVSAMVAPDGSARAVLDRFGARLTAVHINVDDLSTKLENEVLSLGTRIAGFAADFLGLTFSLLLALFFMTMATYFILRHWNEITLRAEELLPFDRRHTLALLDQLRTVGRQVLLGTVVTGLLQGAFATIGYWVTGVQSPVFFGALTALSSLIPAVGSVLVWALVGAALLGSGHVVAGIVLLIYSALIVGILTDYVIRPRLVGSEKGMPAILMFIALFGGIEVFGVIGLILGPVIATLSLAVLRTYTREATAASRASCR